MGILLECTLFKQHGVSCNLNRNVLVELFGVEQFVLKSKTNVVINEMIHMENRPIIFSQNTQYSQDTSNGALYPSSEATGGGLYRFSQSTNAGVLDFSQSTYGWSNGMGNNIENM